MRWLLGDNKKTTRQILSVNVPLHGQKNPEEQFFESMLLGFQYELGVQLLHVDLS